MYLFRFTTFKNTCYLPPLNERTEFIYSLYGNYGSKISHILWWMFCHSLTFRWLNSVQSKSVDDYDKVGALLGNDAVFGINMGTKGPDQKRAILGYSKSTNIPFFAKYATKERAKNLCRNEIKVYELLKDTGLVPKLYEWKDEGNFVFMKCECIKGEHVHNRVENKDLLRILNTLKQYHYPTSQPATRDPQLTTCLAHMDFCPWNMIDVQGTLRIVDWEMAAEMPLGFDLFNYLLQTHFLLSNTKAGNEIIGENENLIDEYFGCKKSEWQPYLDAFVERKINFFSVGQNNLLLERFKEMGISKEAN